MTLLEALKKIKTNGPIDPSSGICGQLSIIDPSCGLGAEYINVCEKWPENTGNVYPVPHPTLPPGSAYFSTGVDEMWNPDHPYGAARLRLLDWSIEYLEVK